MKIEHVATDALVPFAANAKKHDPEQIEKIAASIRDFGFNNPVLIGLDDGIIAGHGRVMAAKRLKLDAVPCIRLGHLTEAQRRAYILADNRLAEIGGGWDAEILQAELDALGEMGVDIDALGFEGPDLDSILGTFKTYDPADEMPPDDEPVELTEAQGAAMDAAYRDWCRELVGYLATIKSIGLVSPNATRAVARIRFLRSLFTGVDFPRWALSGYHPHRIEVSGNDGSIADLVRGVADGSLRANALRWALQDQSNFDTLLRTGMPVLRCRLPLDFPADIARNLIDEFTPAGGAVLDPCHGWGGRLVGFLLSKAGRYLGFDPSPETAAGVRNIIADFLPHVPDKQAETVEECFERSDIAPGSFDFAFTSPPYFDVEQYTGPKQSHAVFSNFKAWDVGFYAALIRKVSVALKPGAVFALQVGNQSYPLEDRARHHAKDCGLAYVETRGTGMRNNKTNTPEEQGEVIVIFRKS